MSLIDPYTHRRMDQRAATNADQAEFSAIIRRSAVVDAGTFDERIAGELQDHDPEIGEDRIESWNADDLVTEGLVGDVQAEIERRAELLGDSYPFVVEQNNLTYRESQTGYYEFCLAITQSATITEGDYVHLPRQFERTSAKLVREYLGWESFVVHTGWPRDAGVGVRFREAMAFVNNLTSEWTWGPEAELPLDPNPANTKDEGVDFIAWKRALDRRAGHLFLLCQCACGNDWPDKLDELSTIKFNKWFHPATKVPYIRAFATPFILSDGNMAEAHRRAGMVFDRIRLTIIAEQHARVDPISAFPGIINPLSGMVLQPV